MTKQELAIKLFEIEAIKFGEFKLKTGILSPIYIDLRIIVSFPSLLKTIAETMWKEIQMVPFDIVCGVPYTALPIATALSLEQNKPMVMRRKEAKDYGTKKLIEGKFFAGQHVLVIEDLVTSGTSVFETIAPLEEAGLKVTDVVVLVDREQGGRNNLTEKGYHLHAVMTITEILDALQMAGKLTDEIVTNVKKFLQENQIKPIQC